MAADEYSLLDAVALDESVIWKQVRGCCNIEWYQFLSTVLCARGKVENFAGYTEFWYIYIFFLGGGEFMESSMLQLEYELLSKK